MRRHAYRVRWSARAATRTTSTIVAIMLSGAAAHGQDGDSTAVFALSELALPPGSTVYVAAPTVGQFEARLVRAIGRELVLSSDGSERTLQLGAGDSLWVLRHSTAQGAKAGAITGLIVTGVLAAAFYSICRNGTDDPCTGGGAFIPMGIAFSGTGALIGAGLGRLLPRWELRWPWHASP